MAIDPALLSKHFPALEWRLSDTSACATVASDSRFIDPSITVLDYKDGTFSASLYLNDTLQLSSWIEDESLEGVLVSLKGLMTDVRDAIDQGLRTPAAAIE
ncbi:hypothetical protein H6F67_00420 [Microcoleus sp. FACHB-1515]|uniref:hypothetical protein n=1 Tax=Cyanophyceae TaxID=3028117 RepID=UPI001684849D|nr:hypothetical protein [Microcoleus sp. FACHB-1515]MBD2088340.1 hypothetical protein [Microcoleus sp. FACHB-1515]